MVPPAAFGTIPAARARSDQPEPHLGHRDARPVQRRVLRQRRHPQLGDEPIADDRTRSPGPTSSPGRSACTTPCRAATSPTCAGTAARLGGGPVAIVTDGVTPSAAGVRDSYQADHRRPAPGGGRVHRAVGGRQRLGLTVRHRGQLHPALDGLDRSRLRLTAGRARRTSGTLPDAKPVPAGEDRDQPRSSPRNQEHRHADHRSAGTRHPADRAAALHRHPAGRAVGEQAGSSRLRGHLRAEHRRPRAVHARDRDPGRRPRPRAPARRPRVGRLYGPGRHDLLVRRSPAAPRHGPRGRDGLHPGRRPAPADQRQRARAGHLHHRQDRPQRAGERRAAARARDARRTRSRDGGGVVVELDSVRR